MIDHSDKKAYAQYMKERIGRPVVLPRARQAEERIADFQEVAVGYSAEEALKEADRCLQCINPTCIDGCPVEIDIPRFIAHLSEGDADSALAVIQEKSNLPGVCGRVCPQEDQCQKDCVAGRKGDVIQIGVLERFAADNAKENGQVIEKPDAAGPKVAVIGSGPAGLTCASDLAKLGYKVTLFEALHAPGGVLTYGIPEFRLPKRIVNEEVETIKKLGVEVVYNAVIGKLFTVDELMDKEGYQAAFVGVGAGLPRFMGIPGENLNGVYSANEFLTRVNLMRSYRFPDADTPIKKGSRVAVVGGGNVAFDAARTALRLGAKEVRMVYRRTEAEMPARKAEIHHAKDEGIIFELLTLPIEVVGSEGWAHGLKCLRMELGEPDESGRRSPVAVEGSEFIMDTDQIIMAIGTSANPLVPRSTSNLDLNKRGYIVTDNETGATSRPGVYAGGDIVTGAATVITAMGAGKKAAGAIHEYLSAQ